MKILLTSTDAGPDILIMAIPALPGAVESAYIVSSYELDEKNLPRGVIVHLEVVL